MSVRAEIYLITNEITAENNFFSGTASAGYVWVAMREATVLAYQDSEGKVRLPVWQSKREVENFLSNTDDSASCHPVQVPLETFKISWLTSSSMPIDELIIDPDATIDVDLVLTKEEFVKGGRFDVVGMAFPLLPLIPVGHNHFLAWSHMVGILCH